MLFVCQSTILRIHTPLFSRYAPMGIFRISTPTHRAYRGRMGSAVKRLKIYATGTHTHQLKPLSKIKVTKVCPPERRVNYMALL